MIFENAMWNWSSPAWLLAILMLIVYAAVFRNTGPRRLAIFVLGLTVLLIAYVSPVGTLADGYLFSAHMIQHLLLLLIFPLCLILSLPSRMPTGWFQPRSGSRIEQRRGYVMAGWLFGVGAMWFWHIPSLCSMSTQNHLLGFIRDLSFVFAGLAFWWPIYSPIKQARMEPLTGIVYLFSACLGCTLLGIYITFTTVSVCPVFTSPVDRIGILSRLYDAGLTPGIDQNLGGLLMWVPPCLLYVGAIVSLLKRWYTTADEATFNQTVLRPNESRTDWQADVEIQAAKCVDRQL